MSSRQARISLAALILFGLFMWLLAALTQPPTAVSPAATAATAATVAPVAPFATARPTATPRPAITVGGRVRIRASSGKTWLHAYPDLLSEERCAVKNGAIARVVQKSTSGGGAYYWLESGQCDGWTVPELLVVIED